MDDEYTLVDASVQHTEVKGQEFMEISVTVQFPIQEVQFYCKGIGTSATKLSIIKKSYLLKL